MAVVLYKGYKKLEEYSKFHNLKLVKGLISTTDSSASYLDEKKFISEINNKNGFVATLFSDNVYIVFCKKSVFANSDTFDRLDTLTSNRTSMLLVIETVAEINKLKSYIELNKPVVNSISVQSFYINPLKNRFSSLEITLYDYQSLEKILLIEKKNLLLINFNDPVIAYLRLIPGQVIKTKDSSPLNGQSVSYRFIK